jgi:hypothetical protein
MSSLLARDDNEFRRDPFTYHNAGAGHFVSNFWNINGYGMRTDSGRFVPAMTTFGLPILGKALSLKLV